MGKIVNFSKQRFWYSTTPDTDLLNKQITEVERDGWTIVSVQPNCNFAGVVKSYTLLIEHKG